MSWEAVGWANRQKLKKCYEQCVLLVLANNADSNGEAFVKWPGRDHWWQYLSDKTRLPKSSLFRHLNTIVALGLGRKSMIVLADGTKRPTFQLDFNATFDIELEADQARYDAVFARHGDDESQSPVETGDEDEVEHDQNDSLINASEEPNSAPDSQSPGETGNSKSQSPVGTKPFPVLGMHKDSLLVPKDSPQPPSGGLPARDDLWEEFVASWREPIPKLALARSAWDHIPTDRRGETVAAAKGYFAWLGAHPKPPSAVSAQSFLRDQAGWKQWLRYIPDAAGIVPSISTSFPVSSPEGKALCALYEIACKTDFLRQFMQRSGAINYTKPMTPRLLALAEAGPKDAWPALTHQQAGAWEDLLRDAVTVQVRRRLAAGDRAPGNGGGWPPHVDGTWPAKGPPQSMMTEDDMNNFKV